MADSSYLSSATVGLGQLEASLAQGLKAAGAAANDEDLPTAARAPFREAVRAVEFAIGKTKQAEAIVAAARAQEIKRANRDQA